MPMTAIRTRLLAPCQANRGLVAATVSAAAPFFKSSRRCITFSLDDAGMNFCGVYIRFSLNRGASPLGLPRLTR